MSIDYLFQTEAHWKTALLQMADGPFFDLMRSYLGDIKTPFNKQRLVDDLAAFLSRTEIQERIALLLDETDLACIAAVAGFQNPSFQDLTLYFEDEGSYADLYGLVLNLEERLILYRALEDGTPRLYLNPVLAPVFGRILQNPPNLFPAVPVQESLETMLSSGPGADLVLGALVAVLSGSSDLFKTDGSLKKRAHEELSRSFAVLTRYQSQALEELLAVLRSLGILQVEEGHHWLNEEKLAEFADLERIDRLAYLAAALFMEALDLEDLGRRQFREELQRRALLVRQVVEQLDPRYAYPELSLRRMWLLQSRKLNVACRIGEFTAVLGALSLAGLLVPTKTEGFWQPRSLSPVTRAHSSQKPLWDTAKENSWMIRLDASFSVIVHPEIPFSDLIRLVRLCCFKELGHTLMLELCQTAVVQSLDRGMSVEDIIALLEKLNGGSMPQSLRWSLEEWARRYRAAALYHGLVLVLAEEQRYLVKSDAVAACLERELAPGVYLVKGDAEQPLLQALGKAGLGILARPQNPGRGFEKEALRIGPAGSTAVRSSHSRIFVPLSEDPALERRRRWPKAPSSPLNSAASAAETAPAVSVSPAVQKDSAPPAVPTVSINQEHPAPSSHERHELLEELSRALDACPMSREQKEALAGRIQRRCVVHESQLTAAAVRYEKLEARGLDYVGKVRLAEQALSQKGIIELFWRGPKGEANHALAQPVSLEKSGGELILYVIAFPEEQYLAVPIGKISLLRRIKRSILDL
ncbi:MAG: hypothetical protein SNJ56_03280 [Termitinemataceae bacterium]